MDYRIVVLRCADCEFRFEVRLPLTVEPVKYLPVRCGKCLGSHWKEAA